MKRLFYILLSAFLLVGCSITNRIIVRGNEEDGLKTIRLVQFPEVRNGGPENGLSLNINVSIVYLFEEKPAARPQMTLETDLSAETKSGKAENAISMILDMEDIPLRLYGNGADSSPLSSDLPVGEKFRQRYLIPENLWVSVVHAKKISLRIRMGEKEYVEIFLNQKEKNKLSELMEMAIRQRDMRFPAVPEGQVKW